MTKKLALQEKVSRKPISRACKFCHQKHLQCDPGRPCKNCVKRGLADTCENVERKKAKYLTGGVKKERSNTPTECEEETLKKKKRKSLVKSNHIQAIAPATSQGLPSVPHILGPPEPTQGTAPPPSTYTPILPDDGDDIPLHFNVSTPGSTLSSVRKSRVKSGDYESSPDVFSSLFANQEYAQLADLLDNNSINSPSQSSTHNTNNDFPNAEFRTSFQTDQNTRPYISLSDNSTHNGPDPESLVDPSMPYYTSPLILRHLIKQPEDVYNTLIQPHNYPKAYHALLDYLKTRFKKEQLITIAKSMAEYRPSFIAATRSLVEMDLLFAERSFQRSLLEYESMSSLSSSPTIMWRRTGEIVAVSTEFSSLTAHTKTELLSKRTFIIELMNEESALDYFKLFSSVAFGDLNGVIITECTLLSPNGEEIRCASTWTVKRDVFDIPMLVVGQFLPILQVR